jgi:hypothetical protein
MTAIALNPQVNDGSRPVLRHPVELATHLGLKIYNRTFRRIDAAHYLAQVVTHLQGAASRTYATEINQVNAAIEAELDRLVTFVGGENRRLDKHLRQQASEKGGGKETLTIVYTQPVSVELAMRTPQMRRYADLIATVEATSRALDIAWYQQCLTTAQRLDLELLLFRNFMRTCINVERLAWGLARRVRDGTEAPGYREMLRKRTGRDPDAATAPAVDDEGEARMTRNEVAHLQASESLAAALLAPSPVAAEAVAASEDEPHPPAETPMTAVASLSDFATGPSEADETASSSILPDATPTSPNPDEGGPVNRPRRRSVRDLVGGRVVEV